EVFRLYHTESVVSQTSTSSAFDYPAYDLLRNRANSFSALGAYGFLPATPGRGLGAGPIVVGYVSGTLFGVLGTTGFRGRGLVESDDSRLSGTNAVVISHELWNDAFALSDSALGARLDIDGRIYTVVGIAPMAFTGPEVTRTDVWLPLRYLGERLGSDWESTWDSQWVTIVGRLRHGVSAAAASAEVTSLFHQGYAGSDVETNKARLSVRPLTFSGGGKWTAEGSVSVLLFTLSLIVLLIAGANVASLTQARATKRRSEIAIRAALGATETDILRLFLIEGIATSVLGAAAAFGVAAATNALIRTQLLPTGGCPPAAFWPTDSSNRRGGDSLCRSHRHWTFRARWPARPDPAIAKRSGWYCPNVECSPSNQPGGPVCDLSRSSCSRRVFLTKPLVIPTNRLRRRCTHGSRYLG